MTHPSPPKIEFPCAYPIKVMGSACNEFRDCVLEVMARHDGEFDTGTVTVRDSRNGRYQSVTVVITARGQEQLEAIFRDLKKSPHVRMVL